MKYLSPRFRKESVKNSVIPCDDIQSRSISPIRRPPSFARPDTGCFVRLVFGPRARKLILSFTIRITISQHSLNTLLDLTEDQRKKLIIPPREPAKLQNRRRATLVVTPASLLGHWLTQIHHHVDDSVNLKVAVHYGQCKALLGTELEDNDIVLTTYGTVGAEYRSYDSGPLLRAKWLRVVLDEGHFIKNHNSQTAKACYELNTRRKWIVSGNVNEFLQLDQSIQSKFFLLLP